MRFCNDNGAFAAEYATHNKRKCPLLIGVSNNRISISLQDKSNWSRAHLDRWITPKFVCQGNDMLDVYSQFRQALQYVKSTSKPAIVVFDGLLRQFGHAATDRQDAYLKKEEIEELANKNVISALCHQAVTLGVLSYEEIYERILRIATLCKSGFEKAKTEPKWEYADRLDLLKRNSQPLQEYKPLPTDVVQRWQKAVDPSVLSKKNPMRKLMNAAIHESLLQFPQCVYIGEDVRHGGLLCANHYFFFFFSPSNLCTDL
ncbi:hypothetical protein RFI_16620 [Reticulomyxa filosa]|uniref:Dehydrogenase E1 component domain-containing protein n=1 Tax=Reticulomyxa filosa TaxID=46433 RepID=X6N5L0_RETFI|nr:hypothetical protein RFI_16620 [Reticulomyxa filosa]|eukprot:ETO20597.1 hypothetical protein RFI_16620 [Reticulomyxa filosa]